MSKFLFGKYDRHLTAMILSCFAGLIVTFGVTAESNTTSPLGINIREIRYWGTEIPTVDFFKRASNGENGLWLTQCLQWTQSVNCWNTHEQALLDLDGDGWPRSLPTNRIVSTILVMNNDTQNPARYPKGRWTVLYDGEGTLSYGWDAAHATVDHPVLGQDYFDVTTPRMGFFLSIKETDPHRTGNYVRNIRVIPPGGTCRGDPFAFAADASVCPDSYRAFTTTYQSQPFHPLFLSDLRPFSALRYVHFADTINDKTVHWQDRPQFTNISWGYNSPLNAGAPIETALDIANTLNASPWLEVPARADDEYVSQFAKLAKARLTTMRPIYLEYYNEAWNGAYPYVINAQWIQQQAMARWPSSTASSFEKGMNWFGMRTKEICAIWKREFSDQPGRVRCVMGGWAANSWVTDHLALSCPLHAAEPGGTACDSAAGIDAVAIAPYFGGNVANPVFQNQIEKTWFTQLDGGLSKLFDEITRGGLLTPATNSGPSLPTIRSWMAANKSVADHHGVALVAYEGGNELFGRSNDAYQTKLQALFVQANHDSRMGDAYDTLLADWKAMGGNLFMVYESTGAYSTSRGNSALLEWQGQPMIQAPKYTAVTDFIANNPCWWLGCSD
ncbi:MAG: cellulose-binding protein [Pseudomonadota bacterium]